jgi:hypothetical protein
MPDRRPWQSLCLRVIDELQVLPAGAGVEGVVVESQRSGRVKGLARLAIRFDRVTAHEERHRISVARLTFEADPTLKEDAARIGIGAGAGAIAGAIAGGRRGAAVGTGVGAAAGTGVVLTTRGDEVTLSPGQVLTTRLTAPLVVRVRLD